MEKNYLIDLECAESDLSNDIQALGYLIDEWFAFNKPDDDFKYSYFEIQNRLNLILKSMVYNRDNMKIKVENGYKIEKAKEGAN